MANQKHKKRRKSKAKKDWNFIIPIFLRLAFFLLSVPLVYGGIIYVLLHTGWLQYAKVEVIKYFLPGIAALPTVFFLNRFLLALSNERLRDFIQVTMGLCLWVMCINTASWAYLGASTQTHVNLLSEAPKQQYPDYLQVKKVDIDTTLAGIYTGHELVSKRHGSDICFRMYVTYPVINTANLYYGFRFEEFHAYSLTSKEKLQRAYQEFITLSLRRIPHHIHHGMAVLERLNPSNERDKFLQAIQTKNTHLTNPDTIIIYTKTADNCFPSPSSNLWYGLPVLGAFLLLLALVFILADISEKSREQNKKENRENFQSLRALMSNKELFPITLPAIIIIGHFIVMTLSGVNPMVSQTDQLLQWGATNNAKVIHEGQWWTLVTAIFTHAGLPHFIGNLISYGIAAFFMTAWLRPKQILLIFLSSGILSSLACALFASYTFLGASGGVMGMWGAFLLQPLINKKKSSDRKTVFTTSLFFIGINIALSFLNEVSMMAHIAGLAAGMMTSLLIRLYESQKTGLTQ